MSVWLKPKAKIQFDCEIYCSITYYESYQSDFGKRVNKNYRLKLLFVVGSVDLVAAIATTFQSCFNSFGCKMKKNKKSSNEMNPL